jgi:hypothetical protein
MTKDTRDTRMPAPAPTDRSAGLPEPSRGGSGGYADQQELDRLDKIGTDCDRGAIMPSQSE